MLPLLKIQLQFLRITDSKLKAWNKLFTQSPLFVAKQGNYKEEKSATYDFYTVKAQ